MSASPVCTFCLRTLLPPSFDPVTSAYILCPRAPLLPSSPPVTRAYPSPFCRLPSLLLSASTLTVCHIPPLIRVHLNRLSRPLLLFAFTLIVYHTPLLLSAPAPLPPIRSYLNPSATSPPPIRSYLNPSATPPLPV